MKLCRIEHGLMVCLASLVGWLSSNPIPSVSSTTALVIGLLSALLVEISTFVLNDYFNIEEDRVSKPYRPIVAGEISARAALIFGVCTTILSIILSLFIVFFYSLYTQFIIILIALLLGLLYNSKCKKIPVLGNSIVAILTAAPFVYGHYLYSDTPIAMKTGLYTLIAFFAALGREIVKGIVDLEGDKVAGVRTIAVVWSPRIAAVISSVLMMIAVVLSLILFAFPVSYVRFILFSALIITTDIIFIKSAIMMLQSATIDVADRVRKLSLFGMLTGILSFIVIA